MANIKPIKSEALVLLEEQKNNILAIISGARHRLAGITAETLKNPPKCAGCGVKMSPMTSSLIDQGDHVVGWSCYRVGEEAGKPHP